MHPVKLIKQDHRTIKALFRKFQNASGQAERQKAAQEIIAELSVHAAIEEQLLYPALRARDKRLEMGVLTALEEHHAQKLVLLELDKMKVDDERYAAKMHVVRESVTAHIAEEEQHLLPRLESLLEADELEAMGQAMVAMKKIAPHHPHLAASDMLHASVITSMITKLSDAGRDVVRRFTGNGHKDAGHKRMKRRAAATAAVMAGKRSRRTEGKGRGAAAH